MKPKVFLTRRLPPPVMERLAAHTDLRFHAEDRVATAAEIAAGEWLGGKLLVFELKLDLDGTFERRLE